MSRAATSPPDAVPPDAVPADAGLPAAPDSAPSLTARLLTVLAIITAGTCGGLIGYAVTDLKCNDGCSTAAGSVGLAAAICTAAGMAVVAVLTLRAMAEWRSGASRSDRTRVEP